MVSADTYFDMRDLYYARFGKDAQCPCMLVGGGPFFSDDECYEAMRDCLEKGETYVYPDEYRIPDGAVS